MRIFSLSWFVAMPIVAFTACGRDADTHMDVVFDGCSPLLLAPAADTTASERESVAWAVAMWNGRAGTQITLEADLGLPILPLHFATAAMAFYGVYDDEAGELIVNRGIRDPHERAVTVAHELGHAFGLWHVKREIRPSVMNDNNRSVEPNEGDALDLAARWGPCEAAETP